MVLSLCKIAALLTLCKLLQAELRWLRILCRYLNEICSSAGAAALLWRSSCGTGQVFARMLSKNNINPEMRYKFWFMCSVSFLPSTQAVASVTPSTLLLSAFLPGQGQIQKIHFPGSSTALSLHQIFPGYIQVGRVHPNPVIVPAAFSWVECFLLFLTLFQHRQIVWCLFLHPEVPSENLSLGCSAALALFCGYC